MIMIYLFIGFVYSISALMMNIRLWKQDFWPEYGELNIAFKISYVVFDLICWPISVALDITRTIIMMLTM